MKYPVLIAILLFTELAQGQKLSVLPQANLDAIAIGETLDVSVFVSDEREPAEGILSVFLDLEYDPTLLGLVPDSLQFGPGFSALTKEDTSIPGTVDDTGAFVTGILSLPPIPSGVGGQPELLYSVRFEALAAGEAHITTNHADILPLNSTTVFGIDDALTEAEISYGSAIIAIVPEPTGRCLCLAAFPLAGMLRKKRPL